MLRSDQGKDLVLAIEWDCLTDVLREQRLDVMLGSLKVCLWAVGMDFLRDMMTVHWMDKRLESAKV